MTFDPVVGIARGAAERLALPPTDAAVREVAQVTWEVFTDLRDRDLNPTKAAVVKRVTLRLPPPVDAEMVEAVAAALFNED